MRSWVAGAFIILSVAAISCGAGPDETFEETFEVDASPRLLVGTGNGNIVVLTGIDRQIKVRGDVTSSANVDLDATLDGEVVTVSTRTGISGNLIGDRAEGRVDFTITVPPGTVVEVGITTGAVTITDVQEGGRITAAAGSITLRGVTGDFSGGIGTGDIIISDSDGSFRFTSGAGSITFEGELVPGGLNEFETGAGDVTVTIQENAGVQINAIVSSGSVSTELDIEDESTGASNSEARFSGTLGDGGAELTIVVGTGAVYIRPATHVALP